MRELIGQIPINSERGTKMSIQRSLLVLAALTCLAFALSPARAATSPYDAICVFATAIATWGTSLPRLAARFPRRLTTTADSPMGPFGLIM